jgi:hypothetical protein
MTRSYWAFVTALEALRHAKSKVKGSGQECPLHTGFADTRKNPHPGRLRGSDGAFSRKSLLKLLQEHPSRKSIKKIHQEHPLVRLFDGEG